MGRKSIFGSSRAYDTGTNACYRDRSYTSRMNSLQSTFHARNSSIYGRASPRSTGIAKILRRDTIIQWIARLMIRLGSPHPVRIPSGISESVTRRFCREASFMKKYSKVPEVSDVWSSQVFCGIPDYLPSAADRIFEASSLTLFKPPAEAYWTCQSLVGSLGSFQDASQSLLNRAFLASREKSEIASQEMGQDLGERMLGFFCFNFRGVLKSITSWASIRLQSEWLEVFLVIGTLRMHEGILNDPRNQHDLSVLNNHGILSSQTISSSQRLPSHRELLSVQKHS